MNGFQTAYGDNRRLGAVLAMLLLAGLIGLSGCAQTTTAASTPPPEITPVDLGATEVTPKDGWNYLENGQPQIAVQVFRSLLRKDPDYAEARFGLGESLRHAGEYKEAEKAYRMIIDHRGFFIRAREGLGLTLLQSGESEAARQSLASTVSEYPEAWRAWLGLAQLRDREHAWKEADEAYYAALDGTTKPYMVYNNHGLSYLARGMPKQAIPFFERALAENPDFEKARTNLSLARAALGDQPGLLDDASDPKAKARELNNSGYVAMLQGRLDEAESLFLQALATHPSYYANAEQNLKILRQLQYKTEAQ
jgi:Flp pilus assembly protein TadD